jgi:hypothetical protein
MSQSSHKTGLALFNFSFPYSRDFDSFSMIGTASASGCGNLSTLTCTFNEADTLSLTSTSVASLRVDFSAGRFLTVPATLFSSILSVHHEEVTGQLSTASKFFSSGTLWYMNCSGLDAIFSHYAVLHGSRNMVIFPCYLNPNSSLLAQFISYCLCFAFEFWLSGTLATIHRFSSRCVSNFSRDASLYFRRESKFDSAL